MEIGQPRREIEVVPEQEPVPQRIYEPIEEPELVPVKEDDRWINQNW